MLNTPLISIVLPTYNGAKYIRTSIDSCLGQTYKNFELIIVDDCSNDGTSSIVRSYKDQRIRYVRNPINQRLPRSLNIGFAHARGEYLTWTSDDNFYMPQALEKMLYTLQSRKSHFVYADHFIFHNDRITDAQYLHLKDHAALPQENCIRACFLYSRQVMNEIGLYDPDMELIEDYDFWVRVSKKFYMDHITEPLYYYRYHEAQLYTKRNQEIKIIEFLFKVKYGFIDEALGQWHLRDLAVIKSPYERLQSRLYQKPKIKRILRSFKDGHFNFTTTRKMLYQTIHESRSGKKNFVFFRRLPPMPEGEWGGLEKLMFDWFTRIDYQKNNIFLMVTKGWQSRFEEEARRYNLPLIIVELPFDLDKGLIMRFKQMSEFLKNFKVHATVFFQAHFEEFSIAELLAGSIHAKGQVFMHENLGSNEPQPRISRKYFGIIPGFGLWWYAKRALINMRALLAKKILVVSKEIKHRYVSWWKYPKARVDVMYHGTDTQKFTSSGRERQAIRERFGIKATDIVLITTARMTKVKCLDRVIKAFDTLCHEYPNLRLWMAGTGPLERELKELAYTLPCARRITFLGQLKDTSDYLKASDIFVLSSDNEGLSLALIEAMSAGLICVSTDCTGSNEAITHEKTGLIVEKSVEGVAEGLKTILSLPKAQQEEIAHTAALFVRENFDINRNVEKAFKTIGVKGYV